MSLIKIFWLIATSRLGDFFATKLLQMQHSEVGNDIIRRGFVMVIQEIIIEELIARQEYNTRSHTEP